MSRKKIKQVDAIRQKTLENVIEEFYNGPHVKTSNEDLMVNVWL